MTSVLHFTRLSKALHWTMAVMILAMLFIGVGMVSSVTERYSLLVAIHRPLGIAILLLVIVRIINRLRHAPPPLPAHMQWWERLAAKASHLVLYALMLLQPLVGWAMLSAGAYPIVLFGSLHLPPIVPESSSLYALLRGAHTYLALLLFLTFLAHLGAALLHGLIYRDGVLASMIPWRRQRMADRMTESAAPTA